MLLVGAFAYGATGWFEARRQAPQWVQLAKQWQEQGHGAESLIPQQLHSLVEVIDPDYFTHAGVNPVSLAGGMSTITQRVAKHLHVLSLDAGLARIYHTGYALGLETVLSKKEILTLFLGTVSMGEGPVGEVHGFHRATLVFYGKVPKSLAQEEFYKLVAVISSPSSFSLQNRNGMLDERAQRIRRLVSGECKPFAPRDVGLENCVKD